MIGGSALLVLLGAALVWLGWSADLNVPNRNGAGEWRSAPRPVRRLLRRGDGPPLFAAIAMEAVGIIWISIGVLGLAGVRSSPAPHLILGSTIILGVTWMLVVLRGRMQR